MRVVANSRNMSNTMTAIFRPSIDPSGPYSPIEMEWKKERARRKLQM
jgi:hypothetical protein